MPSPRAWSRNAKAAPRGDGGAQMEQTGEDVMRAGFAGAAGSPADSGVLVRRAVARRARDSGWKPARPRLACRGSVRSTTARPEGIAPMTGTRRSRLSYDAVSASAPASCSNVRPAAAGAISQSRRRSGGPGYRNGMWDRPGCPHPGCPNGHAPPFPPRTFRIEGHRNSPTAHSTALSQSGRFLGQAAEPKAGSSTLACSCVTNRAHDSISARRFPRRSVRL